MDEQIKYYYGELGKWKWRLKVRELNAISLTFLKAMPPN